MPQPVRSFHIVGDQFTELEALPETLPPTGYLWVATTRAAFEAALPDVQAKLQAWTGAQLFELHVLDLLNKQLPSHYDYTSAYDLLVFRRLAAGAIAAIDEDGPPSHGPQSAISMIDTSPVGFVVFDRVLVTVHPTDCQVREFFANRLQNQTSSTAEGRASARMPTSPADLMLRMVNYMVDSYLELRRLLSKQLDELQEQLFGERGVRRRLAPAPPVAQRPAPARGHLRGPARGDRRMDRRPRGMARAEGRCAAARARAAARALARRPRAHRARAVARAPPRGVFRDRGADALLGAEQPHQQHHADAHRADGDLPAAQPRDRLLRHELRTPAADPHPRPASGSPSRSCWRSASA